MIPLDSRRALQEQTAQFERGGQLKNPDELSHVVLVPESDSKMFKYNDTKKESARVKMFTLLS